jgi:Tfp pilus assembly protein PilX
MLVVLLAHDVYSVTRSGVPLLQTLQARGRALITVLSLTVLVTVTAMSSAGLIVEALTA